MAVQADLGQEDPQWVRPSTRRGRTARHAGRSHTAHATERSTQMPNTDSRARMASPTVT